MNIHTLFSRTLTQCGDKAWLHTHDSSCSGTEVERESAGRAAWLVSLGLAPGDRVMAQIEDSPQSLFLYLGALRAGCIFVPLPTAWSAADMDWFIRDAEPRLIVCDAPNQTAIAASAQGLNRPARVFNLNEAGTALAAAMQLDTPSTIVERADEDTALVLYSAGTTGPSRGARLTHGMLAANAAALASLWQLGPTDTLIAALPLFDVHGLCAALHPALIGGAQLRLQPGNALRPAADFTCATVLVTTPDIYTALLRDAAWSKDRCQSMRLFISTAAHLPPATAQAFGERSGVVPRQCYGSSAAGIITAHAAEGEFRIDSAGRPLPGTRLRIVGSNLKPMPLEHQGEIQLPAFDGWWNQKAGEDDGRTADGWFRTGDIGMWDENGYIVVVGCAADVIASGYYKIYPEDVEHVLLELPGVAEAAVIGLPHAELGQVSVACLVRSRDSLISAEEVKAALQSHLAHYQIPAQIHFVSALPRNPLGRLQKTKLREALQEGIPVSVKC